MLFFHFPERYEPSTMYRPAVPSFTQMYQWMWEVWVQIYTPPLLTTVIQQNFTKFPNSGRQTTTEFHKYPTRRFIRWHWLSHVTCCSGRSVKSDTSSGRFCLQWNVWSIREVGIAAADTPWLCKLFISVTATGTAATADICLLTVLKRWERREKWFLALQDSCDWILWSKWHVGQIAVRAVA